MNANRTERGRVVGSDLWFAGLAGDFIAGMLVVGIMRGVAGGSRVRL